MNRAERRRARAQARGKRSKLVQFSEACAGFCQIYNVHGANIGGVIDAAIAGDDPSLRVVYLAIVKWVEEALPHGRARCPDCHTVFSPSQRPSCLVVAVPFANPIGGVVSGVCKDCLTHGDLSEMTLRRYREIWPTAFEIASGGRA